MEEKDPNKQEDGFNKHILFAALITIITVVSFGVIPDLCNKYESKPVVVYSLPKGQTNDETAKGYSDEEIFESDDIANSAYEEPKDSLIVSGTMPTQNTSESTSVTVYFPLDVNSASVEELVMVRGIGEITANKIVEYRGINGYFYSMNELMNVDGIGNKKLAALNGYLYIDLDSLPETLPNVHEFTYESETEVPVVTTVPPTHSEEVTVRVMTEVTTEEFVMETEEFVTDLDGEFETDIVNTEGSYSEDQDLFNMMETEYSPNFPIELNSADARDLTYIKGIGESTANKIVEYARNVGFTSVDDLLNVSGIGQSKLETIRPYVYVISAGMTGIINDDMESQTLSDVSAEIYRVNINTGSKSDFMQLPGIDENLADEIIELRSTIGYFKNIEELSFALSNEKLSGIWNYVYV
ncbi:MAG: helix-hairpin-helix domain-containing protein [Ruminococcus sp.]|nr:helix-hairpin-helix domain-containing protein [Ruminococcus sp.]